MFLKVFAPFHPLGPRDPSNAEVATPNWVARQFSESRSRALKSRGRCDGEQCMKNSRSNITSSARLRQNCMIVMTFSYIISVTGPKSSLQFKFRVAEKSSENPCLRLGMDNPRLVVISCGPRVAYGFFLLRASSSLGAINIHWISAAVC